MIYDVVIIGAGPAGTHLSYLLAKAGLNVAIVDSKKFPREKFCGGLLTYKTIELLSKSYKENIFKGYIAHSVNVFYKNDLSISLSINSPTHIIRRYCFDQDLLNIAVKHGTTTYLGNALCNIDFVNKTVYLKDSMELKYKQLIGSDGVLSTVRKLAGLPQNQMGFCVEAKAPFKILKNSKLVKNGGIEIYYGDYSKGYGWIFPSKDSVSIGIGSLDSSIDPKLLVQLYHAFSRNVLKENSIKPLGAYIPSGNSVILGTLEHNEMCLIGDAAGLIDPFTGEGLYYALLSAEIASEAILSENRFLPEYIQKMQLHLNKIQDGIKVRNELYSPIVLKDAISAIKSVPKYCESLINETIISYSKSYTTAYEEFKSYIR